MLNIAEYIVLHHSFSPDNNITADWEGIRRYHKSWRFEGKIVTPEIGKQLQAQGKHVEGPWSDIGYHGGLEFVDGKLCWRRGRSFWTGGSHAHGFNDRSVGFVVIGDYDHNIVPDLVWYGMLKMVFATCFLSGIPFKNVIGHRETFVMLNKPVEKQCPGVNWDMDKFRADLKAQEPNIEQIMGVYYGEGDL